MIATEHQATAADKSAPEKPMNHAEVRDAFYGPAPAELDMSARAQRARRVDKAREMLWRKGYTANSSVFVTLAVMGDTDLDENSSAASLPPVFESIGHYAANLIADRTHRLSTPAEIDRFRRDQALRKEHYAEMDRANPNNKNVSQTFNYNVAPDVIQAAAATAGAPARPSRSAEAGDKEKR